MPPIKIGKVWYYDFWLNAKHYKKSTGSKNRQTAVDAESKLREELAREAMGLPVIKTVEIPTLKKFIEKEFDPWAANEYGVTQVKTYIGWYRTNCRVLAAYEPLGAKRLDQITQQDVATFKANRQKGVGFKQKYEIASVNRTIGMLTRIYKKAVEWKIITAEMVPKITKVKGESGRDYVVPFEDQRKLFAACDLLAYQVQAILVDSGLRPSECYRLRWELVQWGSQGGRNGSMGVPITKEEQGKSGAASREIPMTVRVRDILEARFKAAGKPATGWIFPAETQSGHIKDSSIRKQRKAAFKRQAEVARMSNEEPVKYFELYDLRHTFLTHLGMTCDVHTFMRVAGHSNMKMALKYVHPSQNHVLDAMERFERNSH